MLVAALVMPEQTLPFDVSHPASFPSRVQCMLNAVDSRGRFDSTLCYVSFSLPSLLCHFLYPDSALRLPPGSYLVRLLLFALPPRRIFSLRYRAMFQTRNIPSSSRQTFMTDHAMLGFRR